MIESSKIEMEKSSSKLNRDVFDNSFCINKIEEDMEERSEDGTIKIKFKLFDGHYIEGVLIL